MNEFVEGGNIANPDVDGIKPEDLKAESAKLEAETKEKTEEEVKTDDEATKSEENTEAKVEVPEKYELKMQDGFEFDQEAFDSFSPVAKEAGLSQENAQKFADLYATLQKKNNEKAMKDYAEKQKANIETASKNEEFGGANFEKNATEVQNMIRKFDKDGNAAKAFEELGVANHPDIFGLMYRISKVISEDSVVTGANKQAPKSAAEAIFDKS